MSSAAPYTNIAPGSLVDHFADIAEIECPAINAQPGTEAPIDEPSDVAQHDNTSPRTISQQPQPP